MKTVKSRQHLLCTAGAVLTLLLAIAPVHAQQAGPQASGGAIVLNDQTASGSTQADASTSGVGSVTTGAVIGSTVELRANSLTASARANRAALELAPDTLAANPTFDAPLLTAGPGGITASAGVTVVSRQTMNGAQVDADIFDTTLRLGAGEVRSSALEVRDNASDTLVLGNDAIARIAVTGPGTPGSAGLASEQRMGAGSDVTARSWSGTELGTLRLEGASLDNGGNLVRSTARGNASDNRLAANVSSITEHSAVEPSATVSDSGDARVSALFAVLGNQTADGIVRAAAGNRQGSETFHTSVSGTANVSTIASDGNALGAAAYGNSSANALDLSANSIATTPASIELPNFAIANVTGVQKSSVQVNAQTLGGTSVEVSGTMTGSNVSASSNEVRTVATANLASGNQLMIEAGSLGPVALAAQLAGGLVDPAGTATLHSALGVQNVQDYRGAVVASHMGGSGVTVGGTLQSSTLRVDGNGQTVAATGNGAANAATVEATTFGSAVGINNYQTGDANLTARIGSATERLGASIDAELVLGGHLSASGNEATGASIGNNASNVLTVTSEAIGPFTQQWTNWTAYANALGAQAGLLLASTQRLGSAAGSEGLLSAITTEVSSGARISATGLDQSALAIDDNSQRAEALGNLATNRIAASSASYTGRAGSALSSSQVASAQISAESDARLLLSGTLTGSQATISGNTNVALARMNDVDNGIGVETVHATGSLAYGAIDGSGRAVIGDQVLDSWQQASGSVDATAFSGFGANGGSSVSGTALSIADNATSAEPTANRARNRSSISAVDTVPVSGLANAQANSAVVTASAFMEAGDVPGFGIGGSAITVSGNTGSAIAQGNSADNQLSAGSPAGSPSLIGTIAAIGGRTEAPAAVLNRQVNGGNVLATASGGGIGLPFTGTPSLSAGSIAIEGNSVAAGAYGNVASNAINPPAIGQLPGAAIANFQPNSGQVNAFVNQASLGAGFGTLSGSTLSISGNSLAATAVGNQASSVIVGPR